MAIPKKFIMFGLVERKTKRYTKMHENLEEVLKDYKK